MWVSPRGEWGGPDSDVPRQRSGRPRKVSFSRRWDAQWAPRQPMTGRTNQGSCGGRHAAGAPLPPASILYTFDVESHHTWRTRLNTHIKLRSDAPRPSRVEVRPEKPRLLAKRAMSTWSWRSPWQKIESAERGRTRWVGVYTPPGNEGKESATRRYPVLYTVSTDRTTSRGGLDAGRDTTANFSCRTICCGEEGSDLP